MPCNDITEVLHLELDGEDRIQSYSLNKRTCGAPIGRDALLLPLIQQTRLQELESLAFETVLAGIEVAAGEEFLFAKHLVALQEGAAVLLGRADSHPGAACTTVSLSAEGDRLSFEAFVRVEALTERIKSCGSCGSCGQRGVAKT